MSRALADRELFYKYLLYVSLHSDLKFAYQN